MKILIFTKKSFIDTVINRYNRSGRFWQNRFFSTIIEHELHQWAVAYYIERNPDRAKIVEKAEDYPGEVLKSMCFKEGMAFLQRKAGWRSAS